MLYVIFMKGCIKFPLAFHDPKLIIVTFDVWFFPGGGIFSHKLQSRNLGAWAPSVVSEASGGQFRM